MSRRNDALRSVQVRTIFAAMAAAFFPHSGSAFRRPASSSKKAFVKYWTMDAPLRPRSGPTGKSLGWCPRSSIETGKVLRTAASARPRVGSQARSKARDSRSLPEGVPRFESWPTHPRRVRDEEADCIAPAMRWRRRICRSSTCIVIERVRWIVQRHSCTLAPRRRRLARAGFEEPLEAPHLGVHLASHECCKNRRQQSEYPSDLQVARSHDLGPGRGRLERSPNGTGEESRARYRSRCGVRRVQFCEHQADPTLASENEHSALRSRADPDWARGGDPSSGPAAAPARGADRVGAERPAPPDRA